MRNWFKKTSDKKPKDSKATGEEEKQHNISSLYEIVEDHLKSLDYEQIKSISGDFAERFAAHQEIISEIVKAPPTRSGHKKGGAIKSKVRGHGIESRGKTKGRFV